MTTSSARKIECPSLNVLIHDPWTVLRALLDLEAINQSKLKGGKAFYQQVPRN